MIRLIDKILKGVNRLINIKEITISDLNNQVEYNLQAIPVKYRLLEQNNNPKENKNQLLI